MKKINNKVLKIGNNLYQNTIAILAPMAGYTDLPFRTICEEYGATLTFTEMINAKALCYEDEKTFSMLNIKGQKENVAIQIFGSEVEFISGAVEIINSMNKFCHIDINMGCPAPKIVKNGDGSALMKTPQLASRIVESAKKVSKLPITVKIRKGFSDNNINAPEFAKLMQDSGADAITIHGRTTNQYYSGVADWDIIKTIKEKLTIPVIGNGDVKTPQDAEKMFEYTNCDAILIGRASQGNPFIFKQINDYFLKGFYEPVNDEEKINIALKHYNLAIENFGEDIAVREMRKQFNCYLKGLKNSCLIKNTVNTELSSKKVIEILTDFSKNLTLS